MLKSFRASKSEKSRHLKRKDKRQDRRKAKEAAKLGLRAKRSSQAGLYYKALADSGLCILGGGRYSLTLRLSDIDYQIAPPEVQEGIVEKYAQFLNSFQAGVSVQVSIMNRVLDKRAVRDEVQLAPRGDGLDEYRYEINDLISARLASGRNNTVTDKYLTITVSAEDVEDARTQLVRLAAEATSGLRTVAGCEATVLDGQERLGILHRILRPDEPMTFTYNDLIGAVRTTKDFVAPWITDYTQPSQIRLGNSTDSFYQVLVLRELPNWMSDRVLKELAEVPINLAVSIHLRPIEQAEGLKLVKHQISGMDMQRINEEKKAAKRGYSPDLLPHELMSSRQEAVELRDQLEQSNEKLFSATIVVGVAGDSQKTLEENTARVRGVAAKFSCTLETLRYMQRDGLNAVLPLGICRLPIFRTLTTAAAAVMVPFTTQELMHPGGLFYGVNALSKNLIVTDRTKPMNANAFFLGTTGSGKSQAAKFELVSTLLGRSDDEVIIVDPEREYGPLGEIFGAKRIEISSTSDDCINPLALDKQLQTDEKGDPVRRKCGYVLSLCEVLIGGAEGLTAAQRSIVDRCAAEMYRRYWVTDGAQSPTLADLHEVLRCQSEPEAAQLASALELYATGSSSGFSRPTNVQPGRFTIFDIADLGDDLKTFGMMVVLEEIWNRVARNRLAGRRTWLYLDEFHLIFANPFAGEYCQAMFKRARKWGLGIAGITQNIEELMMSERARLMLSNAGSLVLLNQEPTDADALQELFSFSDQQRSFYSNASPGCGLLKMGKVVVPFDNRMEEERKLYQIFSTRFGESTV